MKKKKNGATAVLALNLHNIWDICTASAVSSYCLLCGNDEAKYGGIISLKN